MVVHAGGRALALGARRWGLASANAIDNENHEPAEPLELLNLLNLLNPLNLLNLVPDYSSLRLKDRIRPGVRVLFVGINPGVRSALTGHHFAGYSNRFWRLLHESRLVPERLTHDDDDRLPEWGFGITNLIARPTPGINDLRPPEYVEGWKTLRRKIRRYRPPVVAVVGVTVYRAILPLLAGGPVRARPIAVGLQKDALDGTRFFVLPNPSGRNANFTPAEMLAAFRGLRRFLARQDGPART